MKHLLAISFLFAFTFCGTAQHLTEVRDFGSNPGNLKMFVHIPQSVREGDGMYPMVVVLHGCSQYANRMAWQSGWNKLADLHGFVVLYPEQRMLNNPQGCFCWYADKDVSRVGGEIESIRQMMSVMMDSVRIDSSQIFSYGVSAGALMSVSLCANYPDLFNAGAVLAGGPFKAADNLIDGGVVMLGGKDLSPKEWGDMVRENNPEFAGTYPRLVVYHGQQDGVVNPKNSIELIEQWTNVHGIDGLEDDVLEVNDGEALYTKYAYHDSLQQPQVWFYEIDSIGHALAIDPGEAPHQGGKVGIFAEDMDWHSTWHIAKDFGLIPED